VLRFICALAILLWHYQHFFFNGTYDDAHALAIRPGFPFYSVLKLAYEHGAEAVQLFWMISGFIFYRQYADSIGFRHVGVYDFSVRRFSRLYPLHMATLLLVAALQIVYSHGHGMPFIYPQNSTSDFALQTIFASNWFSWQTYSFNGPIWSVSVEILIYALFFFVVRFMGSAAWTSLIASGLALLAISRWAPDVAISIQVPVCAFYFFAGGTIQRISGFRMALPLSILGGVAAVAALCVMDGHEYQVVVTLAGMFCFLLMAALVGDTKAARPLIRKFTFLGNATYSSYLIHFPIQIAIVLAVDAAAVDRSLFFNPLALVLYLALVITLALAVHRWFEVPAQALLRQKLLSRRVEVADER
jgi:peptidoglycan/LPS O-acetylase OafA/YrhL